ncbi:Ornithine carbamoyltransferase [Pseudobythopirellula maris]|uniref:Ornithine carbamoyltransferase n=1 Tax=Pseudobythopirellula maris TaxID=2527991 RepID=A0A5C5ZPZ6_9BACT|nr:ornithine carbamoyltransferase [Pseudobythopirellula maris]TWT88413.1 Ornithine carbamoyltransferase [Pseudobythopirellula maris]
MRHLITLDDVSPTEVETILSITHDLKTKFLAGVREPLLPGRMMALVFEKQSLRTRVSFEACMTHLGGGSLMLGDEAGFGKRESLADFASVLSEMVDVIVVRSKAHQTVVDVAAHSSCSVVNGLTDLAHPCQALADLYTIREQFGDLKGRKLAWVGDGNNVARSLAYACVRLGVEFSIATPKGYELDPAVFERLRVQDPDAKLTATHDPREAVAGASAVYTDVWASMGQEAEQAQRVKDFAGHQVDAGLMAAADKDAIFMHCLPAKRGEEVTAEVMDGPQSVVVTQAGNRMHAQKGMLVWLLGAHGDR